MSLSNNPGPSPEERDPLRTPQRAPFVTLDNIDPISVQITANNVDHLTDILHLAGITPNDSAIEYLWKTIHKERPLDLDTFSEHLGALDLSLELKIVSRQEIDWAAETYSERFSATLSTKHREGSELGALKNRSDGHPALEGLCVELGVVRHSDQPPTATMYWEPQSLPYITPGERIEFLRTLYTHFHAVDLPSTAPLLPTPNAASDIKIIDLHPMRVTIAFNPPPQASGAQENNNQGAFQTSELFELKLLNPSLIKMYRALEMTGALQLTNSWINSTSREEILAHLLKALEPSGRLDVDSLKMCVSAAPSLIFIREAVCDGASFPHTSSTRVTMTDNTCRIGSFYLELHSSADMNGVWIRCRWRKGNEHFSGVNWGEIRKLFLPYLT